jgi:hypothetical protein
LWGFSAEPKILNAFTIDKSIDTYSVDAIIRRFATTDHIQSSSVKPFDNPAIHRLVVLKMNQQYYFFVNDIKMPIGSPIKIHHWYGNFFGIYIEPMVVLLVRHVRINKLDKVPSRITRFDKIIDGY